MKMSLKTGRTALECERLDIDGRSFLANCESVSISMTACGRTLVTIGLIIDELEVEHDGPVEQVSMKSLSGESFLAKAEDGGIVLSKPER